MQCVLHNAVKNGTNNDTTLLVQAQRGKSSTNQTTATTETSSFDGYVPMLYGKVGISPMEGLFLGIDGSLFSVNDSSISDYSVRASYTFGMIFGVEAGYRNMTVDLDDLDGHYGKIDFSGPFAGAYLKF